jgi:DNA modification methylase
VACKNLNRKFIGMELNEEYYNIACERINKGISSLKQIDGQMDITSFLK